MPSAHRRDDSVCRLLGYVSRTPTTLFDLLGGDLAEFTALSRRHQDGWGSAWATVDGVELEKHPEAVGESQAFKSHSHERRADLGLVHFRFATLGLEICEVNTHPFTNGMLAFAHNGSIQPPSALDRFVPDGLRGLQTGMTDSERYFLTLLGREPQDDLARALDETATLIAESIPFTSLNALVASADRLVAICRYDPTARPDEPDYYELHYRITQDAVIISSTGWGTGWQTLENGTILTVERGTLDVTIGELSGVRAS